VHSTGQVGLHDDVGVGAGVLGKSDLQVSNTYFRLRMTQQKPVYQFQHTCYVFICLITPLSEWALIGINGAMLMGRKDLILYSSMSAQSSVAVISYHLVS